MKKSGRVILRTWEMESSHNYENNQNFTKVRDIGGEGGRKEGRKEGRKGSKMEESKDGWTKTVIQ